MDRSPPALRHPRVLVPTLLCACVAAVGVMVSGSGVMRAEADGEARAASAVPPRPPAPRPPRTISIGWVGDTVLGSRHGVPADGGRDLLRAMRPTLRGADVMIGNLEGVIGTRGVPKCPPGTPNCFVFQAPPVAARTLAWAGFDVMNLANNHAFDHGRVGLDDTVAHLRRAGVAHTGRPGQVTVVERRGVRVAVVGFAAYPWAARIDDLAGAARLVRRARLRADVVIVVMHAGGEGTGQTHTPHGTEVAFGEARGDTRAFAHAVVDAGAHAVFGSGPHVVRGVERRHGRPIFYSTGNFAGFHTFPTAGLLGLSAVAQVRVDDRGRLRGGRWTSVRLTPPGRPAVDPGRASAALAARLSREDFAYPGLEPDGDLRLPARRPPSR